MRRHRAAAPGEGGGGVVGRLQVSFARAAAVLVAAAAALLYLAPALVGLDPGLAPAASVVVLAIGFWATGALPAHLTTLLVFLLVTVLGIAPPSVIFAGFAAPSLWLVFGGLVIAAAIEATGLGARLARPVTGRLQGSYRHVIYGTVAISVGLAFLVPAAMGRIVILLPIFQALAGGLGFERGSTGRTGILLAVSFGTFMPAFAILPANLPNMVLLGAAETLYGVSVSYGAYLLLHFPVLGLLKAILLAELICRLFPDRPPATPRPDQPTAEPWSGREKRLFAVLLLALALWASDWLHGISAGWVALFAGLLCLLPGIGVIDTPTFESKVQFGAVLYVAGILGMVSLIDASGLGRALGAALLEWLPLAPEAPATNFAALVGMATVASLAVAVAGLPAVLTPLAEPIATATGLSLTAVLMAQVVGFSTMLLPYQAPPLMVALALARIPLVTASRLSLALGLLTLLVLAPLDYLWWRWLGWLP